MRVLTRAFSQGQTVTKAAPRRALPDPRFDIKFFIMKAKVCEEEDQEEEDDEDEDILTEDYI